jgi:hypothetical protein
MMLPATFPEPSLLLVKNNLQGVVRPVAEKPPIFTRPCKNMPAGVCFVQTGTGKTSIWEKKQGVCFTKNKYKMPP